MKFLKFFAPSIVLIAILISCKKSDSNRTQSNAAMSYKLNGKLVEMNDDSLDVQLITMAKAFTINGFSKNHIAISFEGAAVGTRTFMNDNMTLFYFPNENSDQPTYKATSGSVTITAISTTMAAGTFQFTAMDSSGDVVTISDGRFNVQIDNYYN